MKLVYKILKEIEWDEFILSGVFFGSKDDKRDGFIHLATETQVESIISKYFSQESLVYVVAFDAGDFAENLKWEKSTSGSIFPHLYTAPLGLKLMRGFSKQAIPSRDQ